MLSVHMSYSIISGLFRSCHHINWYVASYHITKRNVGLLYMAHTVVCGYFCCGGGLLAEGLDG